MQNGSIQALLLPACNGIIGFTLVFIACELGQRMNNAFEDINLTIDQFDWYLFSIEVQRMLSIIIFPIVQQPVTLECLGSIKCTRDVFKKVGFKYPNVSNIRANVHDLLSL